MRQQFIKKILSRESATMWQQSSSIYTLDQLDGATR